MQVCWQVLFCWLLAVTSTVLTVVAYNVRRDFVCMADWCVMKLPWSHITKSTCNKLVITLWCRRLTTLQLLHGSTIVLLIGMTLGQPSAQHIAINLIYYNMYCTVSLIFTCTIISSQLTLLLLTVLSATVGQGLTPKNYFQIIII